MKTVGDMAWGTTPPGLFVFSKLAWLLHSKTSVISCHACADNKQQWLVAGVGKIHLVSSTAILFYQKYVCVSSLGTNWHDPLCWRKNEKIDLKINTRYLSRGGCGIFSQNSTHHEKSTTTTTVDGVVGGAGLQGKKTRRYLSTDDWWCAPVVYPYLYKYLYLYLYHLLVVLFNLTLLASEFRACSQKKCWALS